MRFLSISNFLMSEVSYDCRSPYEIHYLVKRLQQTISFNHCRSPYEILTVHVWLEYLHPVNNCRSPYEILDGGCGENLGVRDQFIAVLLMRFEAYEGGLTEEDGEE